MDINEDILLSDNEVEASNQRKRVSSGDTTETKKSKIRKVNMVCLRVSKIYLILIIYCFNVVLVSPQRVFYSNHVITLHSIKPVTHDDLIRKNADNLIEIIINISGNSTSLGQKGEAQANHLRQIKEDWDNMTMMMFNEFNSYHDERFARGIPFIGRMAALLFDVAGPDEMDAFREMSHKLITLSEDHQAQLKNFKKTLKHDHSEIIKVIDQVKILYGASVNISNEIREEQQIIKDATDLDTIYTTALSLLNHASLENFRRTDIMHKAADNLPSVHMFPKEYVLSAVKQAVTENRIRMPLFLTKEEVHEVYLFQCSMTAYDPKKEQINSILDIPLVSYADSFNPILHGLFEIPYYMGGIKLIPPTKLTENAKNGLGFMFYTSNVC